MNRVITPAILTALVPLILITGCEKKEEVEAAPLRSVRYAVVEEGSGEKVRSFSGVSKSEQEANLSFKVSGTLRALNVAVGDVLEPGQVIAEIDPSEFELQAQQAQADLTRATAEQRNAQSAYKRTRELYENQNASRNDLDTARAAFESAEALVNVSKRALDIAQLNVSYTSLEATESCSVATTNVEVGENVSSGQVVVGANCGDQLKVEVSVPENLISLVETGMSAQIRFDSVPDTIYDGRITEVGVAATGTTFPVSIRLIDPDGLRTGQTAEVRFQIPTENQAIVVPASAVAEDQDGRFVYLVTEGDGEHSGIIKRQEVSVGELVQGGIEIESGLTPGDRVVTAGVSVIRDGLEVLVN